jgi:membrane protein DedA with SNARE-associated domain/rhodanese-related sulfurtransferase
MMLVQRYGASLVFLNVLALQAGLPLPAYPTLIVAGALAAVGGTPVYVLIAVGIAGALIADTGWYAAGRRYGMRILGTLCRVSLSQDTCVRQTESIFQRFGPASMLFAKFVPGFAAVATALAGALRLNYVIFLAFDAVGAGLWVGLGIALGYVFRDAVGEITAKLASLGEYGVMLIAAVFLLWIGSKWLRRHLFIRQLRMDRVTVDELRGLIDEQKVQALVDVRSSLTQAATGRIPGARTVDMKRIAESFKDVAADGEVIVYCACPNEATAVKVAEKLRKVGFTRIRPLLGGIDAWIEAGNEVEY